MFYGSAREHDMDWGQFSIMFRSIFLEGLGRPAAGVRLILKHLVRKFRALGGELKLRSGVKRLAVENGRVTRVVLENDEELEARNVVSSAGWCETMRLCDDGQPVVTSRAAGPAQLLRNDRHARRAAQRPGPRPHDHVLQRSRQVRLAEAGRAVRRAQRRHLLAQQFRLRRAARRRHDADHGAGELRPLARRSTKKRTGWKSSAGTTASPSRPCGSCPTIAAA